MILLSGILNWKTIIIGGGLIILIMGVCTGNKGGRGYDNKPNVSSSKAVNDLAHKAKKADPDYCPRGSGKYHGHDGKVHHDGRKY